MKEKEVWVFRFMLMQKLYRSPENNPGFSILMSILQHKGFLILEIIKTQNAEFRSNCVPLQMSDTFEVSAIVAQKH